MLGITYFRAPLERIFLVGVNGGRGFGAEDFDMKKMKLSRLWPAVLAIAVLTTAATYSQPVPAGTAINVHLTDTISSSSANAGQTFDVVVADPLVMQGWVIVQKGAAGQGHVVAVTPAGKSSHQASVSVQIDWVVSANGQHLPLVALKGKKTPLVIGIEGAYASNFQKGKDVSVGSDLVFPAYTSADQIVTVNAGP